jgi:hypothetical protein
VKPIQLLKVNPLANTKENTHKKLLQVAAAARARRKKP